MTVMMNSYGVAFCPKCTGSVWQIKDESKYCFRCGKKLNWESKAIKTIEWDELHKREYTELLELDPVWLINYLTEMIIEKDEEFKNAILTNNKSSVMALIEQYLY